MKTTSSEEKTRTNITIPVRLKKQLEALAIKTHRSFNAQVIDILEKYLESQGGE